MKPGAELVLEKKAQRGRGAKGKKGKRDGRERACQGDRGRGMQGACAGLGSGLMESVYEAVMAHDLRKLGISVERQAAV